MMYNNILRGAIKYIKTLFNIFNQMRICLTELHEKWNVYLNIIKTFIEHQLNN